MAKNGTVAYVLSMPNCQGCPDSTSRVHPAVYDASIYPTPTSRTRIWGYVCEEAFQRGHGALGTGRGQKLEVRA